MSKKNMGGRPRAPEDQLRRHRYNLLLNDAEKKAMDAAIEDRSRKAKRIVLGAEVLREKMMPFIERSAKKHDISLVPDSLVPKE